MTTPATIKQTFKRNGKTSYLIQIGNKSAWVTARLVKLIEPDIIEIPDWLYNKTFKL